MGFSADVARAGASYKIFLTWAHFVLGPMIINDLRLCRNVDRNRYKLYVPVLIQAFCKKGFIGYWLLTRFYMMDNG